MKEIHKINKPGLWRLVSLTGGILLVTLTSMKTAISIDQGVYETAEFFTKAAGLSRSRLYNLAVAEYVQNHAPDIITEKLNDYYAHHSSKLDKDLQRLSYALFSKEDW